MQERIILAPGCNASELLRTLAKYGINTLGTRIVNGVELSRIALMKSGVSITEKFISSREEPAVIFSFLRQINYFSAASYSDAESLALAFNTMRSLVVGDEEKELEARLLKGTFNEKNKAILEVYKDYISECKKQNKIDRIGIIRKGISQAKHFDAEFVTLKEYPISPLDKKLLEKISDSSYIEKSIIDLFNVVPKEINNITYTEGYGAINEIEDIIDDIYTNKKPLDKCIIASPGGTTYSQTLFDLAKQHNIPITFGCGVSIINSYPATFLKQLSYWDEFGYHGIDALKQLINCEGFDRTKFANALGLQNDKLDTKTAERICKMAGNLRIGFDKNDNSEHIDNYKKNLINDSDKEKDILEKVKILAKELELGFVDFFAKYALLRPEPMQRIDQAAKQVIIESLTAYTSLTGGNPNDIVSQLLNKTVCSENSKEGCLHVTTIQGALSTMRDNLYVCGLSASEFPGSPRENYLLLDEDLENLVDSYAPTSTNIINKKKESLDNLLKLASSIKDINIKLSYSGYNLSELKDQNPSSVLFNYYEKEHPNASMNDFKKDIRKVGYFDSKVSASRLVTKAYCEGKVANPPVIEVKIDDSIDILDRKWSPSALEIFFQCPRRFYLSKVLRIPEEQPDNPFEIISAADLGTMAHSMMEELAQNRKSTQDQFLEKCGKTFDEFLLSRPPVHKNVADKERKEFIEMMTTAYSQEMFIGNKVLAAEEEIEEEHSSGVKLHGYPDRVEQDKDGNYIIADFKTKRVVEHKKDDIDTCLQVVIYAWLCEQKGTNISRCDYRYIRLNKNITCVYNDEMKEKLNNKLVKFVEAVQNKDFPRDEGKDKENCKYCKFADICKWPAELKDEEEFDDED